MLSWKKIFVFVVAITIAQTVGNLANGQVPCGPVTLTPTSATLSAAGETGSIVITKSGDCFWGVTGAESEGNFLSVDFYSWISPTPLAPLPPGLVDSVTFTAPQNFGAERTGKIYVQGILFPVTQSAAPCQIIETPGGLLGSDLLYVANTACERIVEIPGALPALFTQDSSSYEGLEWGPDGWLYAFDPTRGLIHRFDPDYPSSYGIVFDPGVGSEPAQPRDGIFNHVGDLIVVDAATGDLYHFTNSKAVGMTPSFGVPSAISNPPGFGTAADVATAANGDLLVTDSGSKSVWQIPFDPAARSYDSLSATEIVGAGSFDAPGAIVRSANGTMFVGEFSSGNAYLRAFEQDGTAISTPCGPSFTGAVIQDVDIASDDTLYVTSVDVSGVGTLTEIQFTYDSTDGWTCNGTQTIATFTGNDSDFVPLSGVALPFTGRDGKKVPVNPDGFDAEAQLFNFWDFLFGFEDPIVETCEVTASSLEYASTDIQGVIGTQLDPFAAQPVTLYGDGGAVQVIKYQRESVDRTCGVRALGAEYLLSMMGVYDAQTIGIAVCHSDDQLTNLDPFICADPDDTSCSEPCEPENNDCVPMCEITPLDSFYLGGPLPDDPRTSGRTPRTSQAFLVNAESAAGGVEFCGFKEPLWADPIPEDRNQLPKFEGGSTISVQFKLADLKKNGNCQNGPWVTGDIAARLQLEEVNSSTLMPLTPRTEIKPVDAVGGATFIGEDIYFSNPQNKNKPWKIDLKLSDGGVPLEADRFYQITIFTELVAPDEFGLDAPRVFPIQTSFFWTK